MLHINDLTYRISGRVLFDKATVALASKAKVGLLGRNGTGKTTLFRILQGDLQPETGSITLPKGVRIGAVAQEAPAGPETLLDVVLAADKERTALLAEAENAEPLRRAEIEMRLADIGAYSAPSRAASILHGLGFDARAQARPCSDFSGGWRMRVALAAVLFAEPDLLLLDEPTNYLDIEGTLWLYDYLSRYPHSVLVISHDRELLDHAVDFILHLDQGKLTLYRGGYSSFERQRAEAQAQQAKMKVKQEAERKHLMAFVERFRAKATKARQAQSRLKRLAKLEPIAALVEHAVLPFDLPSPERPLSPPMIALDKLSVGYGDTPILQRVSLSLLPDDRIALLGANGNGKSTFCKLLSGHLAPLSGEMRRSNKLKVAYFAQHQLDVLKPGASVFAHVAEKMPDMPEAKIRSRAARLGFPGGKADTLVSSLSGGEKARLLLGLVAFDAPHLLILDEPTNHLDIDSRAALMQAINDYNGAVVLVSHDRFLVEACADRLWLTAHGTVAPFDGDMEDYKRFVLSGGNPEPQTKAQAPSTPSVRQDNPAKRGSIGPLLKQQTALEARIEKLSDIIARIDAALNDGTAFQKEPEKALDLSRKRAEAAAALEKLEDEWLTLANDIENNKTRQA